MLLKYEPSSEPVYISAKQSSLNRELCVTRHLFLVLDTSVDLSSLIGVTSQLTDGECELVSECGNRGGLVFEAHRLLYHST